MLCIDFVTYSCLLSHIKHLDFMQKYIHKYPLKISRNTNKVKFNWNNMAGNDYTLLDEVKKLGALVSKK